MRRPAAVSEPCYYQTEGAGAPSEQAMRRLLAAVLATSVAIVDLAAQAPAPTLPATASVPSTPLPTDALGVSLARIKRRLAADAEARNLGASPLKIEYRVNVFGTAPALRFFAGQDLVFGGVPGSAPTHSDMLYMLTPQAFRSPRVDFLGLLTGAAGAGAKKVQDWRYLRDLRNYQKLVESGVNVPAPKPPQ